MGSWSAHNLRVVFDEDAFVQSLPESVAKDPVRAKRLYQGSLRLVDRFFSEGVRKQCGTDAEKYIAWVRDNYEWLRPGAAASDLPEIAIDEDAKALGQSNRKAESLDAWVKLLERKEQSEVALRVLKRYTSESFDDATSWRKWLDGNRDRLFFDEVGGYGFRVAPKGLTAPPRLARTPLERARADASQSCRRSGRVRAESSSRRRGRHARHPRRHSPGMAYHRREGLERP